MTIEGYILAGVVVLLLMVLRRSSRQIQDLKDRREGLINALNSILIKSVRKKRELLDEIQARIKGETGARNEARRLAGELGRKEEALARFRDEREAMLATIEAMRRKLSHCTRKKTR